MSMLSYLAFVGLIKEARIIPKNTWHPFGKKQL
jgi:hypothetical protein